MHFGMPFELLIEIHFEMYFELPFEIPIPCNNFSSELDCPDSIAGTILSRCYYDKDLQKCTKTHNFRVPFSCFQKKGQF